MNACRYISTVCKCGNAVVSRTFSRQFAQTPYSSRLPGVTRTRPWLHSQMVSLNVRRLLHKQEASKNMFKGRHEWDKVPDRFSVVYNNGSGPWIVMFRAGMITMTGCLAVFYYNIFPEVSISKEFFLSEKGMFMCFSVFLLGAGAAVFSVLSRRLFTRIYFHPGSGNFIGVRRDFFGRLKQLQYTSEDVKLALSVRNNEVPINRFVRKEEKSGWETAVVNIKGYNIQLQGRYFISPVFYNMHLGVASADSQFAQEPQF